jgi:cell division protein FtsB
MANKKTGRKAVTAFPGQNRENRYTMYRLMVIILSLVICGMLLIIGLQYLKQYQAKAALDELENRISEISERQAVLEEEIVRLQDLDYIEALARERLGLVKPGEVIFQLED